MITRYKYYEAKAQAEQEQGMVNPIWQDIIDEYESQPRAKPTQKYDPEDEIKQLLGDDY